MFKRFVDDINRPINSIFICDAKDDLTVTANRPGYPGKDYAISAYIAVLPDMTRDRGAGSGQR
jgi:hypothetical protein